MCLILNGYGVLRNQLAGEVLNLRCKHYFDRSIYIYIYLFIYLFIYVYTQQSPQYYVITN
jgi:hypothetical protein